MAVHEDPTSVPGDSAPAHPLDQGVLREKSERREPATDSVAASTAGLLEEIDQHLTAVARNRRASGRGEPTSGRSSDSDS